MKPVIISSNVWAAVFIKENMVIGESRQIEGLEIYSGKLNGQAVLLIQPVAEISDKARDVLAELKADYLISLGEAYSSKKNLDTGDMVISSAAVYLESGKPEALGEVTVDSKMVDQGLKAAEKFNSEERLCKVVVGRIFIDPGTGRTGRKLNFIPKDDIYCMDSDGYPLTQWAVESGVPILLVRTIVPNPQRKPKQETTQFKWDTAKKNFWVVKAVLDGLKKNRGGRKAVGKVDLL